MPELALTLEPIPLPAKPARVHLTNKTGKTLTGGLTFQGGPIRLAPMFAGAAVRLELSTAGGGGKESTLGIALSGIDDPTLKIRADVTLETAVYPAFEIDVTRTGCSITKAVAVMWPAGPPMVAPTVFVSDDHGRVHPLNWTRIGSGLQGDPRECFLEGGSRPTSLRIVGTYRYEGEDLPIGGKQDGLAFAIRDQGFGFFWISRSLVPTAAEAAALAKAEAEQARRFEELRQAMEASASRGQDQEGKLLRANLEAQARGEKEAPAAAGARREAAVLAARRALTESPSISAAEASKLVAEQGAGGSGGSGPA